MENNALKEALVSIVVDVLIEAKARIGGMIEAHLRQVLERERQLLSVSGMQVPTAIVDQGKPRSRYLDMRQAGEYFGMKPAAFRKMLDRTILPDGILVRFGRRFRIDIQAFEKWLVSQKSR
jgi:hypothetical protein